MSKLVERWRIHPVQEEVDARKVAAIADAFRAAGGWTGRPLLVEQREGGDTYQAWTGSHRLAGARAAGVEQVPVELIDVQKFEEAGLPRIGDPATFFALADSDLQRLALLRVAEDANAEALMAEEMRAKRV